MWHLNQKNDKELDDYSDLFLKGVKKRINNRRSDPLYKEWCDYLLPVISKDVYDESIIKEILVAKPARLFKLNHIHLNELLRKEQCINNPHGYLFTYSERQLRHHLKARAKKAKNRTLREVSLVERYERLFAFLLAVFDYNLVKGNIAYEIAKMKDVNTCTYCNRQYTFTIGRENSGGKTVSKTKPQFDHWFAHMQYPLLSLSFYNLIPSCGVCNSSVKGSSHYSLKTHVHPYLTTSADPAFKFIPALVYDDKTQDVRWSVLMKCKPHSKEHRTIQDLSLDIIYDRHGELEVKDIMDFAHKNNTTYLRELFNKLCLDFDGAYSQAEVYRMLFGVEYDIDKTLNRPFSKLKRDILEGEGIKI